VMFPSESSKLKVGLFHNYFERRKRTRLGGHDFTNEFVNSRPHFVSSRLNLNDLRLEFLLLHARPDGRTKHARKRRRSYVRAKQ
jgi:hypothetical protein